MKLFTKLFLVLTLALTSLSAEINFPSLSGRVVDNASLLSQEKDNLTKLLAAHEKKTTNQFVVVTLKTLEGQEIEEYGYQLGRHWGIGQKGKDNGVLLIVAPNERKVRIEVGYGLEGVLTDKISHDIIQEKIIPYFKKQDYVGGIESATNSILQALDGEYTVSESSDSLIEPTFSEDYYTFLFFAAFVFSLFANYFISLFGKKSRIYVAVVAATIASFITYFFVEDIFSSILMWLFTFFLIITHDSSGKGSSGSSYSSSSSSSSSFGGFSGGGGSFGGGGSSGSW